MNRIKAEQILYLHARLAEEFGGDGSVSDLMLLIDLTGKPNRRRAEDSERTLLAEAAWLCAGLLERRPFKSGNLRTAVSCACLTATINGLDLTASPDDLTGLCASLRKSQDPKNDVQTWLENHTETRIEIISFPGPLDE